MALTTGQRLAEELRLALSSPDHASYGDSLTVILRGISAAQAAARPIPAAHGIWELVNHIAIWMEHAVGACEGRPLPTNPWPIEQDFPALPATRDEAAWREAQARLFTAGDRLIEHATKFPDSRLDEHVPGRTYPYFRLFDGWLQHLVYHAGQIALLKKMP